MAADRVLAGFGVWDFVSLGSTVQAFIPNAALLQSWWMTDIVVCNLVLGVVVSAVIPETDA